MKQKASIPLALALLVAVAVTACSSTLWLGNYVTVNNATAYSGTNQLVVLSQSPGSFEVFDQGLTQTTAMTINDQWSLDQVNWITTATFQAPATNAGGYPWSPGALTVTMYQRFQIITTNSVSVGILQP